MKTKKVTLAMKRGAPTGVDMAQPGQRVARELNPEPAMAAGGGVKIRGTGAAIKGLMARGPMG